MEVVNEEERWRVGKRKTATEYFPGFIKGKHFIYISLPAEDSIFRKILRSPGKNANQMQARVMKVITIHRPIFINFINI